MARSIAEILESNGRAGQGLRRSSEHELDELRNEWVGIGLAGLPFIEFLPIRIVSIIEKQVRWSLADAIDFGEPYSSRAFELVGNWPNRNIFEAFEATASKKITLGRLVSFSFTVGKVSEMLSILSKIFGPDLKQQLSAVTTLWSEDDPSLRSPIIPAVEQTLAGLDRLFRLRHTLVHESSAQVRLRPDDIDAFFGHAAELIQALNWLFVAQTSGSIARTNTGLSLKILDEVNAAIEELDRVRGGSRKDFQKPITDAQRLEYHWDEFCRLSAEKAAGPYFDGTVAPLQYGIELSSLTRWRLDRLAGRSDLDEVDF